MEEMPQRISRELIGANLRSARERLGVSRESLGEAMGLSEHQVGEVERGRSRLRFREAVSACVSLRIDPATLIGGTPEALELRAHAVRTAAESLAETADRMMSRRDEPMTLPLPWEIIDEHAGAAPAAMLRLLARRRAGEPLTPPMTRRLDDWLTSIEDAGVVLAYRPEHGFRFIPATEDEPADPGMPVTSRWLDNLDV